MSNNNVGVGSIPRRLVGRVAIVTASTAGIGLETARRLAQEGATVWISSRVQATVDKVLTELRSEQLDVHGILCHVSKKEDRERLFQTCWERHGRLDILVSNAAVSPYFGPTAGINEAAYDRIMELNVKASLFLAILAREYMLKTKSDCLKSIVFVSSIGGYQCLAGLGVYNMSKTALLGLTRNLGLEWASDNIRVNGVAPGIIKTKFSQLLWQTNEIADPALKQIPLSRFGVSEEIASTIAFLCSNDSSYITGETIAAAGGMQSRL